MTSRAPINAFVLAIFFGVGCESAIKNTGRDSSNTDHGTDVDLDTGTDSETNSNTSSDSGADSDTQTGTHYPDDDGDGWVSKFDCDDGNPAVNPGMEEVYDPPNNVDDDCDGATDESPSGQKPTLTIPRTCQEAAGADTTVGCEFFAVDFDQEDGYDEFQYWVAIANVQKFNRVKVNFQWWQDGAWVDALPAAQIDPLDLHIFKSEIDRHITLTEHRKKFAYRIVSTMPVSAYQINPVHIDQTSSAEASLLYPISAWDTLYYLMGQERTYNGSQTAVNVIAAVDGTEVKVTPSVTTQASPSIPSVGPGVPMFFSMDRGDVLQVNVANLGEGVTGTSVVSNDGHPVGVFSTDSIARIPRDLPSGDHLEEQMSGVRMWGRKFVGARMPVRQQDPRRIPELAFWQVIASEDNTIVRFSAAAGVTGLPSKPVMLNAGESVQYEVTGKFDDPGNLLISANLPIGVSQYMIGGESIARHSYSFNGDPSHVQIAPVEQFLPRYVILVPFRCFKDYAVITRAVGSTIRIDDIPVDDAEFMPVGTEHEVGWIFVEDGVHKLESDDEKGFSVMVVGYDGYESFAYMGGSGMARVNPHPSVP